MLESLISVKLVDPSNFFASHYRERADSRRDRPDRPA